MGRLVVAQVNGLPSAPRRWLTGLDARGGGLALFQALHIGVGLVGQLLLLVRWSPHAQTDLFLLLSGVPWLVSAATLIGGLEMALPAAIHRAQATEGEPGVRRLVTQVAGLGSAAALAAALVAGLLVGSWAARSGLEPGLGLWMGFALGGQVLPFALAGVWRGVLVARDRLIRARLTFLVGSLLTAAGYALLPRLPALSLPLVALAASTLTALLAWTLSRSEVSPRELWRWRPLLPEASRMLPALVALGAAAGLVHLHSLIVRAAVLPLGTGRVTALTVAERLWDAVLTIVVAAAVAPAFPRWAESQARGQTARARRLLRWSLTRTAVLSLVAAGVLGAAALVAGPLFERRMGWRAGAQVVEMVLALLPRFVLLCNVQPLVMKHYARGTPWHPVLGAALGILVVGVGALTAIPRWGLGGVALTAAAGVLPGGLYLGWREWREGRLCAS
jgi:peptidoglycan biosynthesis protein MviN/MurJ (putative lipid II flippase)